MTPEETNDVRLFLEGDFGKNNPDCVKEVEIMVKTSLWADLVAVCTSGVGFDFLYNVYIPLKLQHQDWVSCFPGKATGVTISAQATSAEAAPVKEAAKEVAADDDLDLFADETEEEKKAAEARDQAKASTKKKESGKSSVLMDVKPWDDETDMKKLEEAVRSVELEGLLWGASKLVQVGYGIKKLTIMLTIADDLDSVDSLIEERLTVGPISDYVQSCDIVAFNKI